MRIPSLLAGFEVVSGTILHSRNGRELRSVGARSDWRGGRGGGEGCGRQPPARLKWTSRDRWAAESETQPSTATMALHDEDEGMHIS